jgi:PBP1b-binding outer membrane lipoprotein LpoB
MKKWKLIASSLMLAVVFSSCKNAESKKTMPDLIVKNETEEISYPVKLHYIEKSGMKFMISSGGCCESGTSIRNLTLDSLQVAFYKKRLK